MFFALTQVTTITKTFFLGMGRKTKTETFLVKENLDLRKGKQKMGISEVG